MSENDDIAAEFADQTYEELVDALEELTDRMASGAIGIEEAADLYERAGALHAAALARLESVRVRIDRIAPPLPQPDTPMP